jgi:hypothetical protein
MKINLRKPQAHQDALRFVLRVLIAMCGIKDRLTRNRFQFLREVADPKARPLADRAFVRRLFTKDYAKECCFPGAVWSDQANS